MKRFLSIFLVIVVVVVIASATAAAVSAPVTSDLFTHHLSVASVAIAAPSYTLNEWLRLRKYSRAQWYRTPPDERPDVIGKGRMQRITPGADARWLREQEQRAKAERRRSTEARA